MIPRPATAADIPDLARIHVQAWGETYPGLLTDAEIAARDLPTRLHQWASVFAQGTTRTVILPGIGFAQSGQQTDAARAAEWPMQLLAIYTLRHSYGTGAGQALFTAARPDRPFTAEVLTGNLRARAFYEKAGGQVIGVSPPSGGHASAPSTYYGWRT